MGADVDDVVCGVEALLRTTEDPADPGWHGVGPDPKVVNAVLLGDEWPMGISIVGVRIISVPVWMAMGDVRDE